MKMITKKALSLILSFAMLFGMVQGTGVTAFAAGSGDVTAYYCDSGLFKDSGCTDRINTGDNYRSTITKAEIKAGTTAIGSGAFDSCIALINITVPSSVIIIGSWAFNNCTNLENVSFEPNSKLTAINKRAFQLCKSLTGIAVPSGVETIGEAAFLQCDSLKNVTIPETVVTLESGAFGQCTSLTSVAFKPNSKLETIGDSAFQLCNTLTGVTIPGSVTRIGRWAFDRCTNLRNLSFEPNSKLKTLVYGAFQSCSSLTDVVIPSGVETIEATAFSQCTGLNNVVLKGKVGTVGNSAFEKLGNRLLTFYVPSRTENNYKTLLNSDVMGTTKAEIKTIYAVAVNNSITGGSITASPEMAKVGDTVTLTITPNTGKQIVSGSLKYSYGGKNYNITGSSFTMPASDITITAQFEAKPSDNGGSNHHDSGSSSGKTAQVPTLISKVDTLTGATADFSGMVLPSGVTGVSLNVSKEDPANKSDPQAASFSRALLANPKAGVIGNPVIYNMELLDRNGSVTSGTGEIKITLPVPPSLRGTPHVLRYEPSGTFTDMSAKSGNNMLVFETDRLGYFAAAGMGDSITLDTTSYAMPVNGRYEIGLRVTGTLEASRKVYSTNGGVARVTGLPNGNYLVTCVKAGAVWIMFDIYDSKNRLVFHASVRIDAKTGIRPRGDSARQVGVF